MLIDVSDPNVTAILVLNYITTKQRQNDAKNKLSLSSSTFTTANK